MMVKIRVTEKLRDKVEEISLKVPKNKETGKMREKKL